MSKLAQLLACAQGHRVTLPPEMRTVTVADTICETEFSDAYEYQIGTELLVRAQCHKGDITAVKAEAKRHIIESVFGEFREPIRAVYATLFARDIQGAMTALRTLEEQMFGDQA